MEYPIVQLDAPGNDWIRLARTVERSGRPLWLEAEGEIRGVLLPSAQARRLMADRELQQNSETAEEHIDAE